MTVSKQRQAEYLDNFFGLPLHEKMRAAATVIEDASRRHFGENKPGTVFNSECHPWAPRNLRIAAAEFELDDDREAERQEQVTELAELIFVDVRNSDLANVDFADLTPQQRVRWKQTAQGIIDAGWTKP